MLHELNVYGLIDRDYRSAQEIATLNYDGIYTFDVAEVENLFLVEELIHFVAQRFAVSDVDASVTAVKNFVINTKFGNMIERQICQSVVAESKYQLSCLEIEKQNESDAKISLQIGLNAIYFDVIRNQKEPVYREALNNTDYRAVLKIFNEKGIAKLIGKMLGVENKEYKQKVIKLLRSDCHDDIAKALEVYLLAEIPRNSILLK